MSALFFNYPDEMAMRAVGSAGSYAATRTLAGLGPARRIHHSIVAEAWHRLGSALNLSREESSYLSAVADSLRQAA